jgi:hypothetical protein
MNTAPIASGDRFPRWAIFGQQPQQVRNAEVSPVAFDQCHGSGNVYYVRQSDPDVEVVGGKRIVCPVCGGSGSVSVPVQAGRAGP